MNTNVFDFFAGSSAVSGQELGDRIGLAMNEIGVVLKVPIMYLLIISFLISVIIFIIGSIGKSGTLKKVGLNSLMTVSIGSLIYFTIPLWVGFLHHIGNIMNSGV